MIASLIDRADDWLDNTEVIDGISVGYLLTAFPIATVMVIVFILFLIKGGKK